MKSIEFLNLYNSICGHRITVVTPVDSFTGICKTAQTNSVTNKYRIVLEFNGKLITIPLESISEIQTIE